MVPQHDSPRRFRVLAGQEHAGGHQEDGGQPGRNEVDQVVQPSGRLAQILVPAVVADHAVQGIDGPVRDRAGQPVGRFTNSGLEYASGASHLLPTANKD